MHSQLQRVPNLHPRLVMVLPNEGGASDKVPAKACSHNRGAVQTIQQQQWGGSSPVRQSAPYPDTDSAFRIRGQVRGYRADCFIGVLSSSGKQQQRRHQRLTAAAEMAKSEGDCRQPHRHTVQCHELTNYTTSVFPQTKYVTRGIRDVALQITD